MDAYIKERKEVDNFVVSMLPQVFGAIFKEEKIKKEKIPEKEETKKRNEKTTLLERCEKKRKKLDAINAAINFCIENNLADLVETHGIVILDYMKKYLIENQSNNQSEFDNH